MNDLQKWTEEARDLGAQNATAAATWVTDGNDTDESRRRKLRMIEEDGIDAVMVAPNLSGEWADEMSPRRLFEEITGLDAHAEATYCQEACANVIDALCDAYEEGVSEVFEDACVRELRGWLGES